MKLSPSTSLLSRLTGGLVCCISLGLGLNSAAVDSATVFNEVMYHPANPGDAEWIELHNQMAVNMDLSGWRITGGVDFTFPIGSHIAAGGYLVVSDDPMAVPGSLGPWIGHLDNDRETIRLKNVSGRTMDELTWSDSGRWPVGPDGSGAALAKRQAGIGSAVAEAWAASSQIGGTPGVANFPAGGPPSASLVINEISGDAVELFQVELKNEGASPMGLAGIRLGGYVLAAGSLAPGAFLVVDELQLGYRPADGERLFLISADGSTLLDAAIARAMPQARSDMRMLEPSAATFGSANLFALQQDVVINEIMYHFPPVPSFAGSPAVTSGTVLVPLDATWRYNRTNTDLGPAWAQAAHPVGGGWLSGPGLLGFETTPASLPDVLRTPFATSGAPTYYFETDFTLTAEQLASGAELRLEHVIDDGAAFYINGIEVATARFNLSAGFGFSTLVQVAGVANAALSSPQVIPLTGFNLQPGTNRLSVEVHQQIATGNDMICGARLSLVTTVTPALPPRPVTDHPEEWIELYNKGGALVDLSGWKLDGGVNFTFPDGTQVLSGGFLVVAKNAAALRLKWPEAAAKIIGDFSGELGNAGDRIQLEDALGNPADELSYLASGWSDGGGSSLELRDARSDNANPEAWAASDESGKSVWQTYAYTMTGGQSFGPTKWNEFRLGMLDAGECLVDDVSVRANPSGAATQLIQNGNFEALPVGTKWRMLGNHRASTVVTDPGNAANAVLSLSAGGPHETNHNHLESTFVSNTAISAATTYEVSFRARWLAGSNQLNTRAYYQKLARTTELTIPERLGTPGAPNSRAVANVGPMISQMSHAPALPAATAPVTVAFKAGDPDGVASATLKYRINGAGGFTSVVMMQSGDLWTGVISGQAASTIVHFYVEAADALGAISFEPSGGPQSRALVQWGSPATVLSAHQLRLIMLDADRDFLLATENRLSEERVPGTLIYNGAEVFHDVGVTLQGTAAGRVRDGENFVGYNIGFPPDHLFRGVHKDIGIDRSGRAPATLQHHEIFVRHSFHRAGIPCPTDDLCHFTAPMPAHTGTAILRLASYGKLWVDSQFDEPGTVFNYDITYDPDETVDGNPESLKKPVPFLHFTTDMVNLGNDKEQYRGPFDIKSGKRGDEYSPLMNLCKTMALPDAALALAAPEVLDLDEVLRCTALVNLWGIGDSYYTMAAGGLHHNIRIFTPHDGSGINLLPWDMDFVMSGATNSPLMPSGNNLGDLINNIPGNRRLYLGHIRHLCATAFNSTYMTPWLAHYGAVVGQNFSSATSYINDRCAFAATQFPASVPYAITTNGGAGFTVSATEVIIEGTGWIDIHGIRRAGSQDALSITWPSVNAWRATIPLVTGPNAIALDAYDFDGALINTRSITVTNTLFIPSVRDQLRITELHYHPENPTTPGELAASATDTDFEFIELKNIGPGSLNLGGVHFGAGVDFSIPEGLSLASGQYAVIVRRRSAFEARYGTGLAILGEYPSDAFANGGESITLLDRTGVAIQSFTFDDAWCPSTDGLGWSMVAREENAAAPNLNLASSWGISCQKHGNPGTSNGVTFSTEFRAWQHQHFTSEELSNPLLSSPSASPHGCTNQLLYALGLSPTEPVFSHWPTATLADGAMRFSFRRLKKSLDAQYIPESSTNLASWHQDSTPFSTSDNGDGTETVVVSFPGGSRKFVRLRVMVGE